MRFLLFILVPTIVALYSKNLCLSKSRLNLKSQNGNGDVIRSKTLVVWDCDGVLVDSEALLKQGEVEALEELGHKLTIEDCVRLFSGVSPDKAMENFEKEYGKALPSTFFKEQIENSMDLFCRRLKPLMASTVSRLHSKGAIQCVASGSPRPRVELCIEVAKMTNAFAPEKIYTRELVAKGKPAPDLFLYAADKMGHPPEKCIVIEDSSSGIEAAINAGMEVLAYLGGGHTNTEAYRNKIYSYNVPVVFTEEEVFDFIDARMIY